MSQGALPPFPSGGNWREWARQLVEYLQNRDLSQAETLPQPVFLQHQILPDMSRAFQDGILMYDPALQSPVYSHNGQWKTFDTTTSISYDVTSDSGDGTVEGDTNATDYTGQENAVGACAQVPIGTEVSFYHRGVQYLYAGPRPASIGAGCPDTVLAIHLIPTGIGQYLALSDTPTTFVGSAGKFPKVNPAMTALSFENITEADVSNLDRVRWRGVWSNGAAASKNDMFLDTPLLMIANKATTDRPAPDPVGPPVTDYPDVPTWTADGAFVGVVWSGVEYTTTLPTVVTRVDIMAPVINANTAFAVRFYTFPVSDPTKIRTRSLEPPVVLENQWAFIFDAPLIVLQDTVVGFVFGSYNSSNVTTATGVWGRAANSNTLGPPIGDWNTRNSNADLRISYTEDGGADRTAELQAIQAGTTIVMSQVGFPQISATWITLGPGVNLGTYIEFDNVLYDGTGIGGAPAIGVDCNVTWSYAAPESTDYKEEIGGNATRTLPPGVVSRGVLLYDGVAQAADANAYGVRSVFQEVTLSADWDYLAGLEGVAGGGAGGAGVNQYLELLDTPITYSGAAGKVPTVNTGEDALEFLTPFSEPAADARYLQLTGGITTGQVTLGIGTNFFGNTTSATWKGLRTNGPVIFGASNTATTYLYAFRNSSDVVIARIDGAVTAPAKLTLMTRQMADARFEAIGGGGGTSGSIGATWPASPSPNDQHYLTVGPVGEYMWAESTNGSGFQWVQTNGAETQIEPESPYTRTLLAAPNTTALQAFPLSDSMLNYDAIAIEFRHGSDDALKRRWSQVPRLWLKENTDAGNVWRCQGVSANYGDFVYTDDMTITRTLGAAFVTQNIWGISYGKQVPTVFPPTSVSEFHDPTGIASWRILATTLEIWGTTTGGANGDITVVFPKQFLIPPTVVVGGLLSTNTATGRGAHVKSVTASQFSAWRGNYNNVENNEPVMYHVIGQWDGVS
jgi:hypothetical protein